MHKLPLKVLTADCEDIYKDIARIPKAHRGEIEEGTMCRISCNRRSSYVAVRGSLDHEDATIKIDDKTRGDLGAEPGQTCDFEIEPLNFFMQYYATCYASDPFMRIAFRMSLVSLVLGVLGLVIAFK